MRPRPNQLRGWAHTRKEREIVARHGWPSERAKAALFTLYHRVFRILVWKRYYAIRNHSDDLDQEVAEALCKAFASWQPERGCFSAWASFYVTRQIREYVVKNVLPCKMGLNQYWEAVGQGEEVMGGWEAGYAEICRRDEVARMEAGVLISQIAEVGSPLQNQMGMEFYGLEKTRADIGSEYGRSPNACDESARQWRRKVLRHVFG